MEWTVSGEVDVRRYRILTLEARDAIVGAAADEGVDGMVGDVAVVGVGLGQAKPRVRTDFLRLRGLLV